MPFAKIAQRPLRMHCITRVSSCCRLVDLLRSRKLLYRCQGKNDGTFDTHRHGRRGGGDILSYGLVASTSQLAVEDSQNDVALRNGWNCSRSSVAVQGCDLLDLSASAHYQRVMEPLSPPAAYLDASTHVYDLPLLFTDHACSASAADALFALCCSCFQTACRRSTSTVRSWPLAPSSPLHNVILTCFHLLSWIGVPFFFACIVE